MSARSSAESCSSKCETKVHWIPRGRSEVVSPSLWQLETRLERE